MVRALRSLLRWLFGAMAIILAAATILAVVNTARDEDVPSAFSTYAAYAVFFALAVLYAVARWTARKPRTTRNGWAIAACVVNLAITVFLLRYVRPFNFTFTTVSLLVIAASIAGMVVFAQRKTTPDPPLKRRANRTRVPGDRTQPWFDGVHTVLTVGATWVATVRWTQWSYTHHLPPLLGLYPLLYIALACLTAIVLHECGHALAAHAFQMKLLSFNAGPFQWRKREGGWKFKFRTSRVLGGSVNVVPTNPDQPRWQEFCMVVAGPTANICTGPFFLWAALHAPGTPLQPAWFFLSFTASLSFIVATFNLLPFRTKEGSYSDGARILQLFTNSPVNELHRIINLLQSTLVTPSRFRDLDPDTFLRVASRYPNELTGLHLHLSAVGIFEDAGRIPEARAALAAAQAIYDNNTIDLPVPLHTVLIVDHAYLNRDAAAARLWWNRMKAKKPEPPNVDYWLARTALLWIEGRQHEAEEAWQKADSQAQKLPHFGAYEFDRYRCTLLREELDKAFLAQETTQFPTLHLSTANPT